LSYLVAGRAARRPYQLHHRPAQHPAASPPDVRNMLATKKFAGGVASGGYRRPLADAAGRWMALYPLEFTDQSPAQITLCWPAESDGLQCILPGMTLQWIPTQTIDPISRDLFRENLIVSVPRLQRVRFGQEYSLHSVTDGRHRPIMVGTVCRRHVGLLVPTLCRHPST
jgi:hypothetical protein